VPPDDLGEAVDVFEELPAQPRLPDPGRSGDRDQPGLTAVDAGVEQLLHQPQLGAAPEERCLEAVDPLQATDTGQDVVRPPQPHRFGLALELVLPGVGEVHRAARHPPGAFVDEDTAGRRRRLHPRRRVDGVAGDHGLPHCAHRHRDFPGDHACARC
jgi:hypothetical protein